MPEIIAYGSGEMLKHVFDGIAMLMNDQSQNFYKPLLRIGALVGGLWALSKAFWESSINGLVFQWMIPMVAFVAICLVPTMSVTIIDVLAGGPLGKPITVNNVPLGLARAAQTISHIGYLVTNAVEVAFHKADHSLYNKTGMIFGAENLLEMSRYAITDEHLADTMREFVHNCVTYDLAMELYSVNDLKTAPDIWKLIAENTSNIRMFSLCDPKRAATASETTTPQDKRSRCKLVSCKEGTGALGSLLNAYKGKLTANHLLGQLPHFYQQLTGMAQDAQVLISQQMMMHSIIDAVEHKCESSGIGTNFAIRRAYLQQRNTYEVVGGLAAKSLVVLRNILEALIYAAFIFIMPFALMPMGFKVFLKWLWLLIWIQLWPPFYAILNSGIMTVTKHQAKLIPGIENGLTFLTSTGLHNLALDMQTYAAYASLSIPFLSYALLQGGISAMAQVAGSITGVAQGAGSAAAQDLTTGNYSYGNVQLDTLGHNNQTMHQHALAPSLSTGHFKENYGDTGAIYGKDNTIVQDQISQLPVDIDLRKAYGQNIRRSSSDAFDAGVNTRESFSETQTEGTRKTSEWVRHAADNANYSQAISSDSSKSVSTAATESLQQAASWGKQFGLDAKTSYELLAEAGVSTKGTFINTVCPAYLGTNTQTSTGASASTVYDSAKKFGQESGFTETYQSLRNNAMNEQVNQNDEVGKRLSEGIQKNYEESQTYQQQSDQHFQKANNLSRLADYVESQNVGVNYKLNQELVDFLANQKTQNGRPRGIQNALHMIRHSPAEFHAGVDQFVAMKVKSLGARVDLSTEEGYNKATAMFTNKSTTPQMENTSRSLQQKQEDRAQDPSPSQNQLHNQEPPSPFKYKQPPVDSFSASISQGINIKERKIAAEKQHLTSAYNEQSNSVDQKNKETKDSIVEGSHHLKEEYDTENKKTNIRRAAEEILSTGASAEEIAKIYPNWDISNIQPKSDNKIKKE